MIKLSRRTIAIAAAALTLGTGAGLAAATAASAATAVAPKCYGSNLAVWVNADARMAGPTDVRFHLTFTNTGKQACTLNGFPTVVALTAGGKQLGVQAAHEGGVPAATITLAPGGSAHTIFGYRPNQVIPSCKPGRATQLKVTAPNQALGKHAFLPVNACTTGRVYMYTWRIQAGF